MRKDTRQNLHAVIRRAGSVSPLVSPTTDQRANFFRPIKLRNTQLTKIFRNAIKPWCPVAHCGCRQSLIVAARLVAHYQRSKAVRINADRWPPAAPALDGGQITLLGTNQAQPPC